MPWPMTTRWWLCVHCKADFTIMGNEKAPPGQIFVCGACGKTARWRYGFDDKNKNDPEASHGWDSSCMTWAVLCHAARVDHGDGVGPMWEVVQAGLRQVT